MADDHGLVRRSIHEELPPAMGHFFSLRAPFLFAGKGVPAAAARALQYRAALAQLDASSRGGEIRPMKSAGIDGEADRPILVRREDVEFRPGVPRERRSASIVTDFADDGRDCSHRIDESVVLQSLSMRFSQRCHADSLVRRRGLVGKAEQERGAEDGRKNTFAHPHHPRQRGLVQQNAAQRLVFRQRDAVGDDEPEHPSLPEQPPAQLDEQFIAIVLPMAQCERLAVEVFADFGQVGAPGRISHDEVESALPLEELRRTRLPRGKAASRRT